MKNVRLVLAYQRVSAEHQTFEGLILVRADLGGAGCIAVLDVRHI